MVPHSSTLAWKIPWMEEPGRLQSMGSLRIRHDWATSLSLFISMHWRRKWQPTPGRIPGTGEPGGLPSMGSHRVGHDWNDLAAAAAKSTSNTTRHSPDSLFLQFQIESVIFNVASISKWKSEVLKSWDGVHACGNWCNGDWTIFYDQGLFKWVRSSH